MLSKSRVFRHGNVTVQSVVGSAHRVATKEIPKPVVITYQQQTNNLDETFKIPSVNQQKKVEPFDTFTGIISNSPEVIAFSNFIPVYSDYGVFNDFGNYLQTKQDALLLRASQTVQDIVTIPEFNILKSVTESSTSLLREYLQSHGKSFEELLEHFSLIRKKLDFRYPIDLDTLKLLGVLPPDFDLNDPESISVASDYTPLSIDEILNETSEVYNTWTPTKLWLQCCQELKEVLANGMIQSFLAEGNVLSIDPGNASYYDPFSVNKARTSEIKKFNFNTRQVVTYPIQTLIRGDFEGINTIIATTTAAFNSNDLSNSTFNEKIFSDSANIEESIAKLSHVLCKEYVYSTQMKTETIVDFGYPFNFAGNNVNVWNHLIGQVGSDITDISSAPLGGGKSLVSLAQTVEPDGTEVLSFEDRYINDNVGTARPNAVITPGTFYYLESSINPVTNGFDITRLNRYLTRLTSANNMLRMIQENLLFKPENPYSNVYSKVTKISEVGSEVVEERNTNINSTDLKQVEIKNALSNPINLLRHIEKNVLNGSGIIRRNIGPKLFTNKNPKDVDQDVSPLLISLALDKDDAELQSLMFIHQIYAASSVRNTSTEYNPAVSIGLVDTATKSKIVDLIIERIKKILGTDVKSLRSAADKPEGITISLSTIRDALMSPATSPNLKILNQIGLLLLEFDNNFDVKDAKSRTNGRFFLDQLRNVGVTPQSRTGTSLLNVPTDKRSSYSGVQKTLYLTALFKLCFLMVHAANPERFTSIRKPNIRTQSEDRLVVTKIKNAVVGVFLSKEELSQGTTNFSLLEIDSKGSQSFDLKTTKITPSAGQQIFQTSAGTSSAKQQISQTVNSRQKIEIFELPSFQSRGIKTFGTNKLNKVFTQARFNSTLVALQYDDTIVKAENMLADYDKKLRKFINKFYAFVFGLGTEFTKLKNNLQLKSGNYGRTLTLLSRQLANPSLTRALFTEEQLILTRAKFEDYLTRTSKDYLSNIRNCSPYFDILKEHPNIEYALPIEDIHLVSWNTLLKTFLKSKEYSEKQGINKKIISIGIPQKLHRRMRVNSSNLSGIRHRNSLIKINIFRVNAFLPDVIYRPKSYIFDLKLFPSRVLGNFIHNGFSVDENEEILTNTNNIENGYTIDNANVNLQFLNSSITDNVIKFIPHLKATSTNKITLVDSLEKANLRETDYSFLDDETFDQIFDNHSLSFLMEEYLRFTTDLPFDENKYQNYEILSKNLQTNFSKFTSEFTSSNLKSTSQRFYNDETLMTSADFIIKGLILPKKFDRVFHIIFDPDDFEIDERTPLKVIEKYVGSDGDISTLSKNEIYEPTFDKYYVVLESYEGNEAS